MSNQDAGAVTDCSQNESAVRGSSDAGDARPRTETSELTGNLSALEREHTANILMRCNVGIVLRRLTDKERAVLTRLLDEPLPDTTMVPATEIAGVLNKAGMKVNAPSIRRHRRRASTNTDRCTCE